MCGIEVYLSIAKSNCLYCDVMNNTAVFHTVFKPSGYILCISLDNAVGTQ